MLTGYRIYIDGVLTETHVDKTTSDTININIPDNINSYSIIFYFENFNHSNNLILTNYFTCHTNTYSGLEYLGLKNLSCNDFRLYDWVGMETNAYIDLINSHIKNIECNGAALLYSLTIKGDLTSTLSSCMYAEGTCFSSIDVNVNGLTKFNMYCGMSINSATVNTKNINNFSYMFGDTIINSIKLSDTSNGTNFTGMFSMCLQLTTIPLLNTSKGTNFGEMFYSCTNLTSIPQLDTSNGTDFNNMFYNCGSLTSIPQLDTSNGTNFSGMFSECMMLTTVPLLDLSNAEYCVIGWDSMFNGCENLTDLGGLKGLKTDLDLSYCEKLTHESLMNVINNLAIVEDSPMLLLGLFNEGKLSDDEIAIATSKGWSIAN